jgi:hypothetical protein
MRIAIVAGTLLAGLAFCASAMAQSDLDGVSRVKDYYNEWLSSIPGVTEVDVGASQQGQPEIEIHAVDITNQIKRLPRTLNGFPVVVIHDARNPDEGSLGSANLDDEDQAANTPAAGPQDQSAQLNVNNPAVNQTDRTNSVAPTATGASTGLPMPTAPTAYNPIGVPQEGVPPQPEGVPPPTLR